MKTGLCMNSVENYMMIIKLTPGLTWLDHINLLADAKRKGDISEETMKEISKRMSKHIIDQDKEMR